MTQLEAVAVIATGLAAIAVVLFAVSLRASVVTGPRWAAGLVLALLGSGWAAVWLIAQAASAPAGGWIPTAAVSGLAVLSAVGGGPFATASLRLVDARDDVTDRSTDPPLADGSSGPAGTNAPSPAHPDLLRGGAAVGLIERISVFALLVIGFPEGIAVVLGVKGLGRFGELRGQATPERFIIGTLASVLWAILCYGAVRAVLT